MTRLADLVAGLSLSADLGFGLPPGEAVRSSALSLLLGRSLDLTDADLRAGMYGALLLHLGCISYSSQAARVFGDELVANEAIARTNVEDPKDILTTFLPALLRDRPRTEQLRLGFRAVTRGRRFGLAYESTACEVGRDAARRLGLPGDVQRAVLHSYERWNGGGVPAGLSGDDVPLGSRLAVLSSVASLFGRAGGSDAAVAAVRQQAGSILDPDLADHFTDHAADLQSELDSADPLALVLQAEPAPVMTMPRSRIGEVAAAFGDVVDLKTPFTHGHSRGVAALARRAGEHLGLGDEAVGDLELAGHLHDLGKVAVSTAIWAKPGPLDVHEWEQVRLHGYHTERILAGSSELRRLARLVGMHHERIDGSGYHRGSAAGEQDAQVRVLAAADTYQAMGEARPHRDALSPAEAERELLDSVATGVLDAEAVASVLEAAGHDTVVERPAPAGLSHRELEVLGLLATGNTNVQIADELVISRRTAEHHVQHIYAKIGTSNRTAAAYFAMEHGLLPTANG